IPSAQGISNCDNDVLVEGLTYDDLGALIKRVAEAAESKKIDLSAVNGDVNADGTVNAEDIVLLKKVLLGSAEYTDPCDVNRDEVLNGSDFVLLKMVLVNLASK
ncbi:MAG: hypothetical protein J6W65_08115, partial [Oscillospiraceae bacterium]|nr:hypothetical protein [Oscillospiraceae bacterium]